MAVVQPSGPFSQCLWSSAIPAFSAPRSSFVKPGTDPLDPGESLELEWPQPVGMNVIANASAANGVMRRTFFIGFLTFQKSASPRCRLGGTQRCGQRYADLRDCYRPATLNTERQGLSIRSSDRQRYFTFSSRGIMLSLGPSIVPSLLTVKTSGLWIIIPKSPRATILLPSIL